MKLSLVSILNEIKIDDVVQRMGQSKAVLNKAAELNKSYYEFDVPEELNPEEDIRFRAGIYMNAIRKAVLEKDIPENRKGVAFQWIVSRWIESDIEWELKYFKHVAQDLEKYFQYIRYATEKNLLNIKTKEELDSVVMQATEQAAIAQQNESKKKKIEKLKKEAKYSHYGPINGWDIYIPENKEAAIVLGLGTKWCTAATESENYFSMYHTDADPLFILINKATGDKRQLNFRTEQFMNEEDQLIPAKERAGLINVLLKAGLGKQYPQIAKSQLKSQAVFLIKDLRERARAVERTIEMGHLIKWEYDKYLRDPKILLSWMKPEYIRYAEKFPSLQKILAREAYDLVNNVIRPAWERQNPKQTFKYDRTKDHPEYDFYDHIVNNPYTGNESNGWNEFLRRSRLSSENE